MKLFFCSDYPCALKINGVYVRKLDKSVYCHPVNFENAPFIELCPLNNLQNYCAFLVDENFIKTPPESIILTDLKGAYLITAKISNTGGEFKVFCQEKTNDFLVTIFNDNGKKISIECATDFFIEPLSFDFYDAKIYYNLSFRNIIFVEFLGDSKVLKAYIIQDKISQIFSRTVDDFSLENCLITTEKRCDIAKHQVKIIWNFDGSNFTVKEKVVTCKNDFNINNLSEKIIPFAFLESFLAGGNYLEFLNENVKKNASALNEYIGNFIGVMPPPSFRSVNDVGVVYQTDKNLYNVCYFNFTIEGGKITNLKKLD